MDQINRKNVPHPVWTTLKKCLTHVFPHTRKNFVNAFISLGLDYCNSLYVGVSHDFPHCSQFRGGFAETLLRRTYSIKIAEVL